MEGRLGTSAVGVSWPALRAQAQANRAIAEAMLLAMQAQCAACANAPQSDELHCWYSDALDVAAQRSADVAEPDRFCMPSAIAADIGTSPWHDAASVRGQKVQVDVGNSRPRQTRTSD